MLDDLADLTLKKRKPKPLREKTIEKRHRKVEADDGGWLLKFVSPATPGVPDNIKLRPIPEAARELVARYFRFVEFKAPGKKPNRHQPRVFARLRELGFTVDVIDQLPTKED